MSADPYWDVQDAIVTLRDGVHEWVEAEKLIEAAAEQLEKRLEDVGVDVPEVVFSEAASIRNQCNDLGEINDPQTFLQRLDLFLDLLRYLRKRDEEAVPA